MSADQLRRAAKVLREHAEAASRDMGTSAWKVAELTEQERENGQITPEGRPYPQEITNDRAVLIAQCFEGGVPTFAPYIALMHPPVALALADWLDVIADDMERNAELPGVGWNQAEALARAILREEP